MGTRRESDASVAGDAGTGSGSGSGKSCDGVAIGGVNRDEVAENGLNSKSCRDILSQSREELAVGSVGDGSGGTVDLCFESARTLLTGATEGTY